MVEKQAVVAGKELLIPQEYAGGIFYRIVESFWLKLRSHCQNRIMAGNLSTKKVKKGRRSSEGSAEMNYPCYTSPAPAHIRSTCA